MSSFPGLDTRNRSEHLQSKVALGILDSAQAAVQHLGEQDRAEAEYQPESSAERHNP
jgi:hypothetical protein